MMVCWGIVIAAFIFALPEHQFTQADLQIQIRNDIQRSLLKNPETMGTHIQSFTLTKVSGSIYNGLLIARTGARTEAARVEVTAQGHSFQWKIYPTSQTDSGTSSRLSPQMNVRKVGNQYSQKNVPSNLQDLSQSPSPNHLNPLATVLWIAIALGLLSYGTSQKDLPAFIGGVLVIFIVFAAPTWIWVSIWSLAVIAIVWLVPRQSS